MVRGFEVHVLHGIWASATGDDTSEVGSVSLFAVVIAGQRMLVFIWHGHAARGSLGSPPQMVRKDVENWKHFSGAGTPKANLLERLYSGQVSQYHVWAASFAA